MALRHSQVYEAEANIEGGMSIYAYKNALMMPTFKKIKKKTLFIDK
ncbi:hypothetical protein [Dickeya poaceiphila]|nr:hypothetical protein [Dickeya poaceiphila]